MSTNPHDKPSKSRENATTAEGAPDRNPSIRLPEVISDVSAPLPPHQIAALHDLEAEKINSLDQTKKKSDHNNNNNNNNNNLGTPVHDNNNSIQNEQGSHPIPIAQIETNLEAQESDGQLKNAMKNNNERNGTIIAPNAASLESEAPIPPSQLIAANYYETREELKLTKTSSSSGAHKHEVMKPNEAAAADTAASSNASELPLPSAPPRSTDNSSNANHISTNNTNNNNFAGEDPEEDEGTPILEATLVEEQPPPPVYDAVVVPVEGDNGGADTNNTNNNTLDDSDDRKATNDRQDTSTSFWKRHKILISVSIIAIVLFGGLMATIGALMASNNNNNGNGNGSNNASNASGNNSNGNAQGGGPGGSVDPSSESNNTSPSDASNGLATATNAPIATTTATTASAPTPSPTAIDPITNNNNNPSPSQEGQVPPPSLESFVSNAIGGGGASSTSKPTTLPTPAMTSANSESPISESNPSSYLYYEYYDSPEFDSDPPSRAPVMNTKQPSPSRPPPYGFPTTEPESPETPAPMMSRPSPFGFPTTEPEPDDGCSATLDTALFDTDCETCEEGDHIVATDGDFSVVSRKGFGISFYERIISFGNDGPRAILKETTAFCGSTATSVAISGNTAVMGFAEEDLVRVYERDATSGAWSYSTTLTANSNTTRAIGGLRQSSTTSSTKLIKFGHSVDIKSTSRGDLIVVGAIDDGDDYVGKVYVFIRMDGGEWKLESRLSPSGGTKARDFGTSVSLHDVVIVVGDSRYGDGEQGAFYVYQFEGCSWIKMNGAFVNTGCDWKFGSHVELIDRYHMLVSCHRENGTRNTVYYYTRTSLWTESINTFTMKQRLEASDASASSNFGMYTSTHGNIAIIGTSGPSYGKVYVFALDTFSSADGTWEEKAIIPAPSGLDEGFGHQVAYDGNTLFIASDKNVFSYELDDCTP